MIELALLSCGALICYYGLLKIGIDFSHKAIGTLSIFPHSKGLRIWDR